jgi:cysteine-rich repeat protein
MQLRRVALILCGLAGVVASCVKPTEYTRCGEFTCGIGAICSPDGQRCVAPETVYACDGLGDGERCQYTGVPDGVCDGNVCQPGGCGNGILEAALGEVCDDGNFVSGDGCRGDCLSAETCGDGIQDLAAGELCDCGTGAASVAGCNGPNSQEPRATCRLDCKPSRCGDNVIDVPDETCDDANTTSGDGCSADCKGRWTTLESGTLEPLESVWATSADDAWAVGLTRILHWDGITWTAIDPPVGASNFSSVCGLRPGQTVFVLAQTGVYQYSGVAPSGTWSTVTPSDVSGQNLVFGTSTCKGTSVWIAGYAAGAAPNGRVARWDTSSFTNLGPFGELQLSIDDIWLADDGELYVATSIGETRKYSPTDANRWPTLAKSGVRMGGSTSADITVFMTTGPSIWSFNGSVWARPAHASEMSLALGIHGIAGSTMIVGEQGGVLICSAGSCSVSRTGTTSALHDVFQLDSTRAFIVGYNGTILY